MVALGAVLAAMLLYAERAPAQAPPGYERVPASIKIEEQASNTNPQDNCGVATFIVWPVLDNEDLSDPPFKAHYVWRDRVFQPSFKPDPDPEPFDDEGWTSGGGQFVYSRATTGYHQNQIGQSTASAPGPAVPDCGKLAARYREDYTDDQSQLWVDVPVLTAVAGDECTKAKADLEKYKAKVERLRQRLAQANNQGAKAKIKRKLKRAKNKKRNARKRVKKHCNT